MASRVLIVDQDVGYRQALGLILETLGHACTAVDHGSAALEHLDHSVCDLVFIELFNPQMEGIEAITMLHARHPQLSIVAMTGGWRTLLADELLGFARELGADATLSKPFAPKAIEAALARIHCHEPILDGAGPLVDAHAPFVTPRGWAQGSRHRRPL